MNSVETERALGALAEAVRSVQQSDEIEAMKAVSVAFASAWTFKSLRVAEGVVSLHRAGLEDVADPLRRLLLELAGRTAWLASLTDDEHGVVQRALIVKSQTHRKNLAESIGEELDGTVDDFWDDEDLALRKTVGLLSNTGQLLEAAGLKSWYGFYRAESAHCHATVECASPYVLFGEGDADVAIIAEGEPRLTPRIEVTILLVTETILGRHRLLAWPESVMAVVADVRASLGVGTQGVV